MADDKDKKNSDEEEKTQANEPTVDTQQGPADALSRTPEDLEEEKTAQAAADTDLSALDEEEPKKISPLKRFLKKVNIYFLIFLVLVVAAAAFFIISFLNSQKPPETPDVENQALTSEALKQLANTDASVGSTSQTLNIQGNAVIAGQTLARGNLNVAGSFQSGGAIQAPGLTVSGSANLGEAQLNSLQVATNTAIQGTTTMRDLNVSGTASFSGAVTASQITVTRLILSGNATLEVPNHISFTGSTPSRTVNAGVLGNGGTSSISGSDTAGTVNVNSGNNPTSGCFIRMTFAQAFTRTPRVVVTPIGAPAGQMQYYVDRNNAGFSICSANAPAANQAFSFDYFITY